jgi:hypothetical protein
MGRTPIAGATRVWKIQAPHRGGAACLAGLFDGLHNTDDCSLCAQEVETLDHMLLGCVYSRKTWFGILRYYGLQHFTPQVELPCFEWLLDIKK